jgi:hypothetical protein
MNDKLGKNSYPYKATVAVSGTYMPGEQEAWFYRDGTSLDVHAQVSIGRSLYHITIGIPATARQKRTQP